ncbi:MAG: septum formation inhibitor Maf [Nitrospirae bacterium]|nr:septum formation inhibitor Maf [Nitrospirota bacterium]
MPDYALILASNSPRRRELLEQAGIKYVADPAHVDETALPGETPEDHVRRLALFKAETTAKRHASGLVLGADTVVVVDGEILGKPADEADAVRMLGLISGRSHEVITGVALYDAATGRSAVSYESTVVRVRALTPGEIAEYVATGEPMDKAGAYGIQGRAAIFVEGVTGCFFNVVGLPLALTDKMVRDFLGRG